MKNLLALRGSIVTGLLGLATACGGTSSNTINQLNLDRPVDVAFACYGGLRLTVDDPGNRDAIIVSPMPSIGCETRSLPHAATDPQVVVAGQENLTADNGKPIPNSDWYGLILQQGPGTVALAKFGVKPSTSFSGADVTVLDTDPFTPGKNGISVGEGPLAIVVDTSGCYAVTANAGSYDLSVVDLDTAFDTNPATRVDRLEVTNGAGTFIGAKPMAMSVAPQSTVIGTKCPATAQGLAYVAYPGCHLVAGIDMATGAITSGVRFDSAGTPTMLDAASAASITCPDESAGELTRPGTRPVSLDLERDPRTQTTKLVIGADNSASITIVELDATTARPASLRQIALENTTGRLGVTDVVIAPTVGTGGSTGKVIDDAAPGGDFQFVYAVANDDTIRVADVFALDKECDTQVDPRYLTSVRSVKQLSCLPVGDPATPPRRSGAKGPGIELTNDAIPTSIDIARVERAPADMREGAPTQLVGYFGFITATSGATYVLNVDDDYYADLFNNGAPLDVSLPLAIANQLRDSIADRGKLSEVSVDGPPGTPPVVTPLCDSNGAVDSSGTPTGGPRATTKPLRNVPAGTYSTDKVTQLPNIRQVLCEGSDSKQPVSQVQFAADPRTRFTTFPDLRALRTDESWSIAWEGTLSRDNAIAIDGPAIRESSARVDGLGLHLEDGTQPFCAAGVEPYDFVQFRGCDPAVGDNDCPTGYRCYTHPESQVPGLGACMLDGEAERLAEACKSFLTSIRRYTVATATTGELLLLPRRHELRTSPIDGCVSDQQCMDLADYGARTLDNLNPKDETSNPDTLAYACVNDQNRVGIGDGTGKRCEETCSTTADCVNGTVCEGGFCMEGVIPPQACINAPQRYELRASEAFTVVGTRSGYVHPIIADASGKCVKDPTANPLQIGRFTLDPRDAQDPTKVVQCDPAADPVTGVLPGGGMQANPCSETVDTADYRPRYVGGTCTLDPASPTEIVTRPAPAVKFRNKQFTIDVVDTFYPGDQVCIGDRLGPAGMPLAKVPLVYSGFELDFRQVAGFAPLVVPIAASFPVKVVRGPTQSIWVVDEGDFLSTSNVQPSTRGKVFRVEPYSIGVVNTLQ